MAVYLDPIRKVEFGRWKYACHMVADTLDELHSMAVHIGLRHEWYQPKSWPHYDLLRQRRVKAVARGAVELSRREFALKMRELKKAGIK